LSIALNWTTLVEQQIGADSIWHFSTSIGLLIIGFSKEKEEDEMTMSLRLNAAFTSFLGGIIAHMVIVLINYLMGDNLEQFTSVYATNYILIMYVLYFHYKSRRIRA
jgi:hypothetical protein